MAKHATVALGVLAGLLSMTGVTLAQGGPGGMPDRKEILAKINEAMPKLLEKSPEVTVEIEGICKLTYKAIPTEPTKIAEMLGEDIAGKSVPQEQINQYMGMFQNEITEALNKIMADVGKFEALKEIKVKSKAIPGGEHRIGILFKGEQPAGIRIFNADPEVLISAALKRAGTAGGPGS